MCGLLFPFYKSPMRERWIRHHAPLRAPSSLTHRYVEQLGRQLWEPMLGFGFSIATQGGPV